MLMLPTIPAAIVAVIKLAARWIRSKIPLKSTCTKPARSSIPPNERAIRARDIVHIMLVIPPLVSKESSCWSPVFEAYPVCKLLRISTRDRS